MENYRHIPEEFTEGKKKIVIADISDSLEAKAKDVALEKSTELTEKPKGFWNRIKHFGTTVWKRSEIFQTIEKHKAEEEIKKSGNLFVHEEGSRKDAHSKEVSAITNRFSASAEFEDEFIHKRAGESREQLGNTEAENTIKLKLQGLLRAYARGALGEAEFFAEKDRVFAEIQGVKPEALGKGKMYADNLFEIAKQAKEEVRKQVEQRIDHETAVRSLDLDFEVVVGKAKAGVRTEAQFNAVDNIVDKIQRLTGGVFNEKAVAVAVATANTVFSKVVAGSVKRAATFFGLGMAASGGAAALKESRKLEVERMQHARETAQGKQIKNPDLAKRRKELEESRIQTKKVKDLEGELQSKLFEKLSGREVKDLTPEEFTEALSALADIETRIQISDTGVVLDPKTSKLQFWKTNETKKVDLIGYSDITKVDQEREQLDILRARAKVQLKKWATAQGKDFASELATQNNQKVREVWHGEVGITKQQEVFQKLKKEKVVKAFAKGALLGGAIGLAVQEIRAVFDDAQEGAFEHGWKVLTNNHYTNSPGEKATLLEGARRRVMDFFGNTAHGTDFSHAHEALINGHHFKLPDGYELKPDGHGAYKIFEKGKAVTEAFKLNSDGSLPADSEKYLNDHGFGAHTEIGHGVGPDRVLTLDETKAKFPDLAKHARHDWHDNPGEHFSNIHNRLLEFEGKQQNVFLEQGPDGTVYMDARMVLKNVLENLRDRLDDPEFGLNPDGTFDQKLVDLKEDLKQWVEDGTLQDHVQAAIIPTEAANKAGLSQLVEGAVGGKIALPPEISAMFTDPSMLRDGHLPFKFLELRIDGHVIATAHGGDIEVPSQVDFPVTVIGRPENPTDFVTEPPFVVPAGRRKGLEETKRVSMIDDPLSPPYTPEYIYLSSASKVDPERTRRYKERFSPKLRENPDIDLDHHEELKGYFGRMNPERLLKTKMLAGQAGEMGLDVRISVNIPVAGHQEGENIYKSLENYTHQTLDPSKFEICLFVNHPDVDTDGNLVKPDKTLSEIERFKKDYPKFNIKVMYQILPINEAKIGNIRKYLNDAVLWRHFQRGANVPDLIMVSNDADNKGMAPEYLENFSEKFEQNPKVDAFLGQIDWDPEAYINNPLMHIGTRFFQYVDVQARRRDISQIQSSGANFAFRSSIYAAVDGYDDSDVMAEDVVLGGMIKTARYGAKDPARKGIDFAGARVSRLYTNARRGLVALEKGLAPIEQWNRGFSAFDAEVRGYSVKEGGIDFTNKSEVSAFIDDLENVLNRTLRVINGKENNYWQNSVLGKEIKKSLRLLGIKYSVKSNGDIKIEDAEKLIEGLKDYKIQGMDLMRKKIGPKIEKSNIGNSSEEANEALGSKEKSREVLLVKAKEDFAQNPYEFVYGNKLQEYYSQRLGFETLMKGLCAQYGISETEYSGDIKNRAKSMRGIFEVKQAITAQLLRDIMIKNPNLSADWASSGDSGLWEKFNKDIIASDLKDFLKSKTLTVEYINQFAQESGWSPMFVLESAMSSRPQLLREANRQFRSAVNAGRFRDSEANKYRVFSEVLEEYNSGSLQLRKTPKRPAK